MSRDELYLILDEICNNGYEVAKSLAGTEYFEKALESARKNAECVFKIIIADVCK